MVEEKDFIIDMTEYRQWYLEESRQNKAMREGWDGGSQRGRSGRGKRERASGPRKELKTKRTSRTKRAEKLGEGKQTSGVEEV